MTGKGVTEKELGAGVTNSLVGDNRVDTLGRWGAVFGYDRGNRWDDVEVSSIVLASRSFRRSLSNRYRDIAHRSRKRIQSESKYLFEFESHDGVMGIT
jgi:hypothetical protein